MKRKLIATIVSLIVVLGLGTSVYATPTHPLPPIPNRAVIYICPIEADYEDDYACPYPELTP